MNQESFFFSKRCLVTGGAGFIGSHLCERLLKLGAFVRCLDNLSTGSRDNIKGLLDQYPNRFEFVLSDIRNLSDCIDHSRGMDYILHEAALGSVPRSIENPIATHENNINGFLNIMVAAKEVGIKRVIFAASSSTYGDSAALPKREEVIGRPLSPYAVTKLVNELYADVFAKVYHVENIGLRYFNVFGPRQNPAGPYAAVIPLFVDKLRKHESPQIHGDGENSRDFTYIENVVRMNLLALQTEDPEAVNQIYNTACGERTTINQLYTAIREIVSEQDPSVASINPTYVSERKGDIPHSLASIDKAHRLLGYTPAVTVKEGLVQTVRYYLQNTPG